MNDNTNLPEYMCPMCEFPDCNRPAVTFSIDLEYRCLAHKHFPRAFKPLAYASHKVTRPLVFPGGPDCE